MQDYCTPSICCPQVSPLKHHGNQCCTHILMPPRENDSCCETLQAKVVNHSFPAR